MLTMEMKEITKDEMLIVAVNSHKYGGSFERALGNVLPYADEENLDRIKDTFHEFWGKWLKMGRNRNENRC